MLKGAIRPDRKPEQPEREIAAYHQRTDTAGQGAGGHVGRMVDADDRAQVAQMLPVVASLAMGAMSKHVSSGDLQDAGSAQQSRGLLSLVGPLLAGGNSGSLTSGVIGLASRLFGK